MKRRVGEASRCGEGGVTSVCKIDVKIALACSEICKLVGGECVLEGGAGTFQSIGFCSLALIQPVSYESVVC
jgi:hypothetical protein